MIAKNKNKIEAKLKFQGQSSISQRLFDLHFDWIELKFSTSEPNFFKKRFLIHDNTQDANKFKFFEVPIGNSKCVENVKYSKWCPNAQVLSEVVQ